MSTVFSVTTTRRFDRELKKLASRHDSLSEIIRAVLEALRSDPYNLSRQYAIKKLEAVPANEGQYRIRSGRFRFRYDVEGQTVCLKACSLRREDTYK